MSESSDSTDVENPTCFLRHYLRSESDDVTKDFGFTRNYKIIRELGSGQFGTVFFGKCKISNFKVAVKETQAISAEELKEIMREPTALASFDHPNVIKYHHAGWESYGERYIIFLVMELCKGTLQNWIDRKTKMKKNFTVNMPVVQSFMNQLAAGLQHIHSKQWIHGDLKPDNILFSLQGDNIVKIGDFGLARKFGSSMSVRASTQAPTKPGSIDCRSPEQIQGNMSSNKSDMFALGTIFKHLMHVIVKKATADDFSEQESPVLEWDYEYIKLSNKMTSKRPEDRATTDEVISTLAKLKLESPSTQMKPPNKFIYESNKIVQEVKPLGLIDKNIAIPSTSQMSPPNIVVLPPKVPPRSNLCAQKRSPATQVRYKRPAENNVQEKRKLQLKEFAFLLNRTFSMREWSKEAEAEFLKLEAQKVAKQSDNPRKRSKFIYSTDDEMY